MVLGGVVAAREKGVGTSDSRVMRTVERLKKGWTSSVKAAETRAAGRMVGCG